MDIKRGLKAVGYEIVAMAGSGADAIRLAGEHHPDLVLMDIRLKGQMDGIEAGREIRQRFRIPVIFLTAYADADTVQRSKSAEPFGYLLKPFEDSELNTAIEIALHKRAAEEAALGRVGEELRQSEERYQLLVNSIRDYAVVMLNSQGRIIDWNPGAEIINGYSGPEVVGQSLAIFYRPEDVVRNKPDQLLWTAAYDGKAGEEGWRVRKNGSKFWAEVLVTALHDKSGKLLGFAEITRDITARKQAHEEIRQLNATLEHRVQLRTAELSAANRELEAFTYSVAHDLRGPLRGIRSYLSLLKELQLRPEAEDYLSRGSRCADRMNSLIDDLLKLAQLGRHVVQRQEVDLEQLVRATVAELEQETRARQIQWRIGPLPAMQCDAGLVKLVFVNLVENAIKYTLNSNPAKIEVGCSRAARDAFFFVRDNGIGFDMKYADKLFRPFSRLHREEQFQGTGIGLTIVERIIARHGGRIWVDAAEGRGATFYFTLGPSAPRQAATGLDTGGIAEMSTSERLSSHVTREYFDR